MPMLKMQTSVKLDGNKKETLLQKLSATLTETTGKPEEYVMVVIEDDGAILMGGKSVHGACIDIRGIGGFNKKVNSVASQKICELLEQETGIKPRDVYITFTDVAAQNWGWNGGTFG